MSQLLLPLQNVILPELHTAVEDAKGRAVTGELDFSVNGTLQWAVELLRNGDKIGEHLGRFDLKNDGKYRKVDMSDYHCRLSRTKEEGWGSSTFKLSMHSLFCTRLQILLVLDKNGKSSPNQAR